MDVRHYAHFSELVKGIRRINRMSQRDMARALCVSPGYVGQWELRLSQPSPEVASKLCRVFEIDDVEYVQRLAYAERAPEWLRDSIVAGNADPDTLTSAEKRLLRSARRLGAEEQVRLVERVEAWVDGFIMARGNGAEP